MIRSEIVFMKIEGPDKSRAAGSTRKADKPGRTGSTAFSGLLGEGSEGAAPIGGSMAIAGIDALLAAQASDDPAQRAARTRMVERADTLLDELEKIRRHMLAGTLTVGDVVDIADVVASHREKITDPKLLELLDEIDLRAQVEIAKMNMAITRSQLGQHY